MKKKLLFLALALVGFLFITPFLVMVIASFMGADELVMTYGGVLQDKGGEIDFVLLPSFPTLRAYVELLFDSPGFFVMFWRIK